MVEPEDLTTLEIVARTVYGEARGEPLEGQQAVASVIMNRSNIGGWWGSDPKSVCLKPYQFSCWLVGDPNRSVIMAVEDDDPIYGPILEMAQDALNDNISDPTSGCDSYLVTGTDARWAEGLTPVIVIGHHSFYKTV